MRVLMSVQISIKQNSSSRTLYPVNICVFVTDEAIFFHFFWKRKHDMRDASGARLCGGVLWSWSSG
ncbi:uncharacterized protein BO72DRAFT_454166 [Aspergillus fijiensis CBS 313.89]|uniref:Uncharacterized protein n=1 Tax=Aspergillus fijiensis CBS 313.89 TaxID=1448319 RepID=A0A8G1VTA3_9EURO|nr:uncharacterized protein BO72DRAFT_454166 [Aspergillus fijiensis CBS 313.89]RAK70876.1 hypothetical protein BO72DRAFT_454166 [Aspergillus fijiensis CBS 313.89]